MRAPRRKSSNRPTRSRTPAAGCTRCACLSRCFASTSATAGIGRLFCFWSDKRVDFRDLVRDLSARLHLRIEMRQVGVRDEAKQVGGIGSCGRELCCSTFLPHFAPVSIKMAKNQRLVLNPTKVAGQCGRLKCCLMYEDAQYVEASKGLPREGKQVHTPDGVGRVDDLDILGRRVRVSFPDRPPATFDASEVRALDANVTPTPATGTLPAHNGPALPEEDAAGIEDSCGCGQGCKFVYASTCG